MKKYVNIGLAMGFNNGFYFNPKEVDFSDADTLRDACKANDCGKYNKYWTCPPAIGSVMAKEAKFKSYDHGVIMQLIVPAINYVFQPELFSEISNSTNDMGKALRTEIGKEFSDTYMLGMSGCTLCDECSYPDHKCCHPNEMVPCISGHSVNVYRLWDTSGYDRPGIDMTDLYVIILFSNE